MKLILSLIFSLLLSTTVYAEGNYTEPYRPQYHFSPRQGWIGDPSGLMLYQGKYHMYWWGKVESSDLVHYKEVSPMVMKDTPKGTANFTGSIAIDKDNSAGMGRNEWVAAMTLYDEDTKKQSQGIAFSRDGLNFFHYDYNPVIDLWSTEFRDPTVFWYKPAGKWIMVVAKARERTIKIYSSDNLKDWRWESDFNIKDDGDQAWECPDLFQVPVQGKHDEKKWVLVVSVNWNQERYFVGDFDGRKFTLSENYPSTRVLVDKGLDYYASRTFRDYDGTMKQPVTLGWIATWAYAQKVPSTWGKGFWSLPRLYSLKEDETGWHLLQAPVPQLSSLRQKETKLSGKIPVGVTTLSRLSPSHNMYEMEVTFDASHSNTFGLNLCCGNGKSTKLIYDTDSKSFIIDRTNSSDVKIPDFDRISHHKIQPIKGNLRLHIFVDKSSIEIFANDGANTFTLLTYAGNTQTGIEIFALRPGTTYTLHYWPLKSIWNNK